MLKILKIFDIIKITFQNYRVLVRLGELDERSNNICANGVAPCTEPQDFQIEKVIYHSKYNVPKYSHDIALIRIFRSSSSKYYIVTFYVAFIQKATILEH